MSMATITRKGRKFVLVPVEEYERMNGQGLPVREVSRTPQLGLFARYLRTLLTSL